MKPANDPDADKLRNKNLNASNDNSENEVDAKEIQSNTKEEIENGNI